MKITVSTKSEMVYKALRKAITEGEMKPGERYSIAEIADKYGVSRSPVSEAVKLIKAQDLIEILPNVGFEIRMLSREEIEEVLNIRGALEGLAIRKVIKNITSKEMDLLRVLLKKIEKAVQTVDLESYLEANEEFHFTLYKTAKSRKLDVALQEYWLHEVWYAKDISKITKKVTILIEDHQRMLQVIENKEFEQVQKLIEEHIEHCLDIVIHNLEEAGLLLPK